MRILLVEDDVRLQDSLADNLRQAGFAVDVSGDGIEGLYYGEEFPIDLAIIDLGLPGLSGLELIRKLRKSERRFPILIARMHIRAGCQKTLDHIGMTALGRHH